MMVTLLRAEHLPLQPYLRQLSQKRVDHLGPSGHLHLLILPQIFLKHFLRIPAPLIEHFFLFLLPSKNIIKILKDEFE